MDINDYQEKALKTAAFETPEYPLGLMVEEVGEVMGKISKYMRKHKKTMAETIVDIKHGIAPEAIQLRDDVIAEMGDVAWAWVVLCYEMGILPGHVLRKNIRKLRGRTERGTICGSGDDR